jgi:hypothetical protein
MAQGEQSGEFFGIHAAILLCQLDNRACHGAGSQVGDRLVYLRQRAASGDELVQEQLALHVEVDDAGDRGLDVGGAVEAWRKPLPGSVTFPRLTPTATAAPPGRTIANACSTATGRPTDSKA